jgi:hypothetical protein
MTPGDRVAQLYPQTLGTHFSRLLRHAWVTVGLFFNPGHHTGLVSNYIDIILSSTVSVVKYRKVTMCWKFSLVGEASKFVQNFGGETSSCSCRWVETMSLNCGHGWAYCSFPRCYMSVERHGGMILTGGKPRNSERNLSQCHFVHKKIPHGLNWARTTDFAGRGRLLTACTVVRPRKVLDN